MMKMKMKMKMKCICHRQASRLTQVERTRSQASKALCVHKGTSLLVTRDGCEEGDETGSLAFQEAFFFLFLSFFFSLFTGE